MKRGSRFGLLFLLIAVVAAPPTAARPGGPVEHVTHHDHILGTSLDLTITADREADAFAAEDAVLAEIERLRLVFSLYDPTSELSKLNRTFETVPASPDLLTLLGLYDQWQERSGGAFNGQLGNLVSLWKQAEKANRPPDEAAVQAVVRDLNKPAWRIDTERRTVQRLTPQVLNLNAIAKGFILQRAADAGLKSPGVRSILVNLGGDIRVAVDSPVAIGIQDPFRSEDNARPIAAVKMTKGAIATSGGYQRFQVINGKRYSHILDPRTGRPAEGVSSATVIATDNATANALATTLCVLSPEEGLKLVATQPGAECLIVAANGERFASPGLKLFDVERTVALQDKKEAPKGEAWPADYQVNLKLELPTIENTKKYRRPYVAVWIEDADGKAVRTLSVWGQAPKYLKDLFDWWKIAKSDNALVKAVTRATRGPGKYDLTWDGKNDKGDALPQGTYTVKVEVHREHGKHVVQTGKIECKAKDAKATLDKNEETAATAVEYAKKKK